MAEVAVQCQQQLAIRHLNFIAGASYRLQCVRLGRYEEAGRACVGVASGAAQLEPFKTIYFVSGAVASSDYAAFPSKLGEGC